MVQEPRGEEDPDTHTFSYNSYMNQIVKYVGCRAFTGNTEIKGGTVDRHKWREMVNQ